jgi:hypothetical protein
MKEGNKKIILYVIASVFILIVLFIIISLLLEKEYVSLLWMCYTAMALIAVGIIMKKPDLILSQIIILFIPDLLWIIDSFFILITGNYLLGITRYLFIGDRTLLQQVLSTQHLVTVPLALFALSLMKIKKSYKPLIIGLAEIMFFFGIMFITSFGGGGVNCLPDPTCVSITFPTFIPYYIIWIVLQFSFVIISYFAVTSLPFIKLKK